MKARALLLLLPLVIMALIASGTPAPSAKGPTITPGPSSTPKSTLAPSSTPAPTVTPLPTATNAPGYIAPYPSAPLCASHAYTEFHTLWNGQLGCHYDHEHGTNPFVLQVADAFPGFDLESMLGGVQIGHTNPSSPAENTAKHGGFKWQVQTQTPHDCDGYQGSPIGVSAAVIQYHTFGDYSVEFNARVHSAVALLRQCKAFNPTDYGYLYVVQHLDYGQRVVPYQGSILPYPDTPNPAYDSPLAPYFTLDCFGGALPCDKFSTRQALVDGGGGHSIWTSQNPERLSGSGSPLLELLFRVRDNYQALDGANLTTYPFTFAWLCSGDGGQTYQAAPGCRYNNSTTRVHEIYGTIPAAWDNLAGFDSDPRPGRITAEGYVTRFGDLAPACQPGAECFPIKMVNAFVGYYGALLIPDKTVQGTPAGEPERSICFTSAGVLIGCDEPVALDAGWIGPSN